MAAQMLNIDSADMLAQTKKNAPFGLVLHFGADWCAPCADVNKWLAAQAAARPKLVIGYVDAEKRGELAEAEEVTAVPHVVFYRPGNDGAQERVAEVSGFKEPQLAMNLNSLYGDKETRAGHESMEAFLKYLINKDRVMIFITGTPSRPRCGFTGRLIEMLGEYDVKYSYYDVMADDDACAALKTFSDWPTYPQVYVGGELIGGMDICKEMHEKGELAAALGATRIAASK